MKTIYDKLKMEHDMVKDMMKETMKTKDKAKFMDIQENLIPHLDGEEKFLYPLLMEKEHSKQLAYEALEEHEVVRELLSKIEREKEEIRWWAKFKVLMENLEHHIIEEERELFAHAKKDLVKGEEEQILADYDQFKGEAIV